MKSMAHGAAFVFGLLVLILQQFAGKTDLTFGFQYETGLEVYFLLTRTFLKLIKASTYRTSSLPSSNNTKCRIHVIIN